MTLLCGKINVSIFVTTDATFSCRNASLVTRQCSDSANLRQGVQPQLKVIRGWNADFQINPDSDTDVCWIAPKISWCQSCRRVVTWARPSWQL